MITAFFLNLLLFSPSTVTNTMIVLSHVYHIYMSWSNLYFLVKATLLNAFCFLQVAKSQVRLLECQHLRLSSVIAKAHDGVEEVRPLLAVSVLLYVSFCSHQKPNSPPEFSWLMVWARILLSNDLSSTSCVTDTLQTLKKEPRSFPWGVYVLVRETDSKHQQLISYK